MQRAPAVRFPAGRPQVLGRLALLVWLVGGAACTAWCFQSTDIGWRQTLGMTSLLLCGGLAFWAWHRFYVDELHWDGQQWWMAAGDTTQNQDPIAVQPQLCIDGFGFFLLRLTVSSSGRTRWCGLQRADDPARWGDLRRALYSSGTASGHLPAAPGIGMGAN